jgi:hypothetical protein
MPHNKLKANNYYLPKVDYKEAKRSWFVYAGKAYPVLTAPASVFRAALLERYPNLKLCAEYEYVVKDELDYYERWWLLNLIADHKRGLALYGSREQAERACTEQMVG